jgi:hypothetical protein
MVSARRMSEALDVDLGDDCRFVVRPPRQVRAEDEVVASRAVKVLIG